MKQKYLVGKCPECAMGVVQNLSGAEQKKPDPRETQCVIPFQGDGHADVFTEMLGAAVGMVAQVHAVAGSHHWTLTTGAL